MRTALLRLDTLNNKVKLRWLIPILLGLLFSLGDTVATNGGQLAIGKKLLCVKAFLFSLLFVGLFACVDVISNKYRARKDEKKATFRAASKIDDYIFVRHGNKATAILFVAIALCWIPWMVMLFPGVCWSDTSQQLLEHFGLETLTDHHPFPMTLLIGLFADLGNVIFGSVTKGLFILICLQCMVAILFFSKLINEIRCSSKNRLAPFLLFCFVALFPLVPLMFCSLAKDTISCAFFVAFVYELVVIFNSHGEKLDDGKTVAAMLLFAVSASLVKKPTGYVSVVVYLFLAAAYRTKKRVAITLTSLFILVMLVFWAYPSLLLPAFSVQPGGKQESIATIIQQVAHDVTYDGESLSKEDKELIDDFLLIDYDDISKSYNWQIVDPVKWRGLNNESRMGEFLKLWAKNTINYPGGHLEAWLGLVSGWITFRVDSSGTPNYMVVCTYSGWLYDGIEQCTDVSDQMSVGAKYADEIFHALQSVPFLNFLFYRSTWGTIVPALLLFLALGSTRDGRIERASIAMPALASLIPLAITPVSIYGGEPTRYLFPIVCVSPFLFAALRASKDTVREAPDGTLNPHVE